MIKLKLCPFCGGKPEMDQTTICDAIYIKCADCLGSARAFFSTKEAIDAWNRRANDDGE